MKRVAFLGQKKVGELAFEALIRAQTPDFRVVGVCSNDKAEGVWWKTNRVAMRASSERIPFISNAQKNTDALRALLEETRANILLSVQHPHILPQDVIEAVRGNTFNLHNAKLPEYRGYNAVNHAILNGDLTFTSTVHWMETRVDSGPIAYESTFPIGPRDTAALLYEKAIAAGLRVFADLIAALREGSPIPRRAPEGKPRFYPRSSIEALRRIDDPSDPSEVDRKARAFHFPPFESAYLLVGDCKYYVVPNV